MKFASESKYLNLLYKRGFIFSDQPVTVPAPTWEILKLGHYWFGYDPFTPFVSKIQDSSWGILLGLTFDLFNSSLNAMNILDKLLLNWDASNEKFYNYLDTLSGRFLLMIGKGEKAYVFQDACGMRSVFYSAQYPRIASHLNLLLDNLPEVALDKKFEGLLEKYTSYHLPGFYTTYENIFSLTPNTFLSLPEQKIKRFFPREPLGQEEGLSIYSEIEPLMISQIEKLVERFQLLTSLSAGLDSRATLALLKKYVGEVLFFTYYKENDDGLDVMNSRTLATDYQTASDITQNLRLNLVPLPLDYKELKTNDYKEFDFILKKNTFLHHNHYLAWQYFNKLPKNGLHLRSNVNEIFKGFYRGLQTLPQSINAENMAACYSKKAIGDTFIQSCFQNFIETVDFDAHYNYDPYDLFYWEYRLGIWHSSVLLESDVSHDTFCLFNNRWILTKILSLPPTLLDEHYFLHQVINNKWPVLNYWPINGDDGKSKPLLQDGINLQNAVIEGFSLSDEPLPVYSKKDNDQALFYLDVNAPEKGDRVSFTLDLPVVPEQGYFLTLLLRSPYLRRKLRGRMRYEIILDNMLIGSEDIADWNNENQIQIVFQAEKEICELKIRVCAQTDCEPWHWGSAGKITIGRIELKKNDYKGLKKANATSPFTMISVESLLAKELSEISFE